MTAYLEAVEKVEALRKRVDSFQADAYHLESWARGRDDIQSVGIGFGFGSMNGVLVRLENVREMAPAVDALRSLAKLGYRTRGEPPDRYDEIRRLAWPLYRDDHLIGWLMVFLADDGVCHFTQTGTKEEPVYDIVCEGGKTVAEIIGGHTL